jgi:hypothetical protein
VGQQRGDAERRGRIVARRNVIPKDPERSTGSVVNCVVTIGS